MDSITTGADSVWSVVNLHVKGDTVAITRRPNPGHSQGFARFWKRTLFEITPCRI